MGRLVTLAARERPFSTRRTLHRVPYGATLAALIDVAIPDPIWRPHAVATVRGEVIPREWWPRLRPKPGAVVEIAVVPHGGNALRLVLTLAIVAAAAVATVYTGGAAAPLFGTVGAGILGATAGAAISVGGMMLVNALVPVEPLQLAHNSDKSSPTYSIAGGSNSARFKQPVAQVLGRHRIYPSLAAPWYTEEVGDDQYLRGLLDIGLAPLVVTDIKLGETSIDQYDDVEYAVLPGTSAGVESSPLYPGSVVQDQVGTDLTHAAGEVVHTLRRGSDEWSIDISFSRGLIGYGKNTGDPQGASVDFSVRYRTAQDGNTPAGSWSAASTHTVSAKTGSPIRRAIGGSFATRGFYDLGTTRVTDDHDPTATGSSGAPHVLDQSTWESVRSINHDAPVNLPGVVRLALRIRASKQLSGTIQDLNVVATSIATAWNVATQAWATDTTNGTRDPAALMRLVLQGPGQPRPAADDQIALTDLQAWSALCQANGWTCDFVVDRDMSTMEVLKVVAGCGRGAAMNPDAVWTVATDTPKATPTQHYTPRNTAGFRWKKINARQPHALRVSFVDGTNGWKNDAERMVYMDGYGDAAMIAANPALLPATEILDWEMPGCTDPDLIYKHARKRLAEIKLRPEQYEIDAFWDSLVNTRGDWIKVSHDTIESGFGYPRIATVESAGGKVTALGVDDAVVLDGTGPYGIAMRLSDRSAWSAPIVAYSGESYRLVLETPVDLAAAGPIGGELATVGLRGEETDDVLVIGIRRGKDHTATITAVPLAPAVHTAEVGPIPAWSPALATPAGTVAPLVWSVTSDSSALHRDADGGYRLAMVVSFGRSGGAPLDKYIGVQVSWTEVGTGAPTQTSEWPADVLEARLTEVRLGETYEVRARYRIRPELVAAGRSPFGPWSGAVTHLLDGPQLPPPDPGVPYLAGDRVVWSYPAPPPDFAGFALRVTTSAGQDWDAAQSLTDGLYPTAYVLLAEIPSSAVELLVRAEDATGNLSLGAARISVVGLPRPKVVDILVTDFAAQGFPGTITGGAVVGGTLEASDTADWLSPQSGDWLSPQSGDWLASSFTTFTYVLDYAVPSTAQGTDTLALEIVGSGEFYLAFRSTTDALIKYAPDSPLPAATALLPPGWVPYGALLAGGPSGAALRPWRDGLRPTPGDTLEISIFGRGGSVRPSITGLKVKLQSALSTAVFGDQAIAAGGQQVLLPAGFRVVDWVHGFLHLPSAAVLLGVSDKAAAGGPVVIAYDSAGNSVSATAEVTVGYA